MFRSRTCAIFHIIFGQIILLLKDSRCHMFKNYHLFVFFWQTTLPQSSAHLSFFFTFSPAVLACPRPCPTDCPTDCPLTALQHCPADCSQCHHNTLDKRNSNKDCNGSQLDISVQEPSLKQLTLQMAASLSAKPPCKHLEKRIWRQSLQSI